VGRKAAAQSLADVAAMGARPTAMLVGVSLPGDLAAQWALQLTDGLRDECALVGASVVGGDVVSSDVVTISASAIGSLDGRDPVTRAGAGKGDLVAVCGRLGWSAAGYAVLSRGFRSPRVLVQAHLRPQPPYEAGRQAAEAGATAMCDVSDGLVQDLGHIATASGVRIELDSALLPVDEKLREISAALGVDPLQWVLGGGEDHALAACFPAAPPSGWHAIGRVVAGEGVVVTGAEFNSPGIEAPGWDHFRSRPGQG
jgi:thiamine-monophosphate kinase